MRVRFAPSPTGFLHIGGARTALFDWLLARGADGTFILRIEDTDTVRSKLEFEKQIISDLRWLGLDWEEGPESGGEYGPYRQSERMDHYLPFIDQLVNSGHAYRCTCSKERLDEVRKAAEQVKAKPRYDRHCRELGLGPDCGSHVIRFKTPITGSTVINDLVKGRIEISHQELDDFVILRTDGSPVYNMVVVVDDLEMKVSHVVRGDDHINNTPKQILLYEALGVDTPAFGHLPLILGKDRSRLSKRHGATSVGAYRDMGILREAMVNYLARLGWAHGDQEVFSSDELIASFSLEAVNKAGASWDMDKLLWLNQVWMKSIELSDLVERTRRFYAEAGVEVDERLPAAVLTVRERSKTLIELVEKSRFYFVDDDELVFDAKSVRKFLKDETRGLLTDLGATFSQLEDWSVESLESLVGGFVEARGIGLGKVAQPIRVAMTGSRVGPGLFEMLVAIGKETAVRRIAAAVERCGSETTQQ